MSKDKKRPEVVPVAELSNIYTGRRTIEWERASAEYMNLLQNQSELQESDEEKKKKIEYATRRQYWTF
ncbi:hypothetical protein Amet_2992 [Alkaliphilus metalliredigens QYMF]|uniref:Uncharacterized protein n=1 Tax=Alkaliphilus metalliredigens (strain QYMF) TaxID=293826 RepID=A6TSG8_ALKMQ|nr:hypothetical protein [Alkaliphilus metalliredigens]ABR49136.1 hypothetical protein Amet_2992 [Alkaliphilus metalliredigens QYMF]